MQEKVEVVLCVFMHGELWPHGICPGSKSALKGFNITSEQHSSFKRAETGQLVVKLFCPESETCYWSCSWFILRDPDCKIKLIKHKLHMLHMFSLLYGNLY